MRRKQKNVCFLCLKIHSFEETTIDFCALQAEEKNNKMCFVLSYHKKCEVINQYIKFLDRNNGKRQ